MISLLFVLVAVFSSEAFGSLPSRKAYPQIISHRGASGYLPEHSLQAYQTAINLLTDYIEPDLCLSKDGVFVAMHDLLLDDTTNVADLPQYADRKTTKVVDGKNTTGYFISDFLYSELLDLRLLQRLDPRTDIYDGYFTIPSFDQIMSLAQQNYNSSGRMVGIYPELKHPSFFKSLGFNMEDMFLNALVKGGYQIQGSSVFNDLHEVVPVVVQCFEATTLQYLREKCDLPLVLLLEIQPTTFWTKDNLGQIASYAQAIGPEKSYFGELPYDQSMNVMQMIRDAGLFIHPWTFRADMDILPKFHNDFALQNMYYYCCLGIDASFTEFPDRTRESLDLMSNYTAWVQPSTKACNINCVNP